MRTVPRRMLRMDDIADVVAGLVAPLGPRREAFGLHLRDDAAPVLDERRRLPVNLHPGQRVPEDAAMDERSLRTRMRAEIAQAALQHERLAEALDVAARERQLAELQRRR